MSWRINHRRIIWNIVIKLRQKINELLIQPAPEEDTLEELFLKADRIGNKYQTSEEIATFNQQLSAEVNVVNELIKPNAVIASHANEAATCNSELQPDARTATFIEETDAKVYLPISGRTLSFDADGNCTHGCT